MSDINKERHLIQPFIDWLVDNNKVEKSTLLFSYMETYLAELSNDSENTLPTDSAMGNALKEIYVITQSTPEINSNNFSIEDGLRADNALTAIQDIISDVLVV